MIGLIELLENIPRGSKCRVRMDGIRVLGVPAVLAHIESPARPRQRSLLRTLDSCAGTLGVTRVTTVIFSDSFPHRDFFLDRGFREGDCGELLRVKAAEILSQSAPRHERVLLSGPRWNRRASKLLLELGEKFRFVLLDVPHLDLNTLDFGCNDLGLSPELLRRDRVADVDAAFFSDAPAYPVFLPDRCRVLRLGEKTPLICGGREIDCVEFTLPDALERTIPENFPRLRLLSAALECGALRGEDVKVSGVL